MYIVALFPTVALIASIAFSRFSGNDKMPIFILFLVALNFLFAALFLWLYFSKRTTLNMLLLVVLPSFYAIMVMILARYGVIDSFYFLGIR